MDNLATIQESLDYIEENLQTELTAAELAQMAHVSLFHYYRLFQQATGLPVMHYILRRRLLHGVYAMGHGSTKTDAALRFGFDTYAGFYRAFCREFGSTPSEFLKSNRAKRPWRIDLTKEEHMTVTHKKAARILEHWGLEAEPIRDIYYDGTGNKNDSACYVGEHYVLKYTADPEKLNKHIGVSKAIADIGLLSAIPVKTPDGREFIRDGELYFYLTRRLPGEQLTSHRFGRGDGRFVGEILGQLHLALQGVQACVTDADLLATVRDWALPQSKEALGLSEEFCKTYLETFSRLYPALPRQIIHRDPNPGNIICAEEQWGFLDFDLSERNARIYDPCYAATAVLSEGFDEERDSWPEVLDSILRGYDSVVHLTKEEWEAIPYVILANQFVCVAWFAGQDRYAELFGTNKRMTLWLIDHIEELKNN